MRETLENEVTGARFVFHRRSGDFLLRPTAGKKAKRKAEEKPQDHAPETAGANPTSQVRTALLAKLPRFLLISAAMLELKLAAT